MRTIWSDRTGCEVGLQERVVAERGRFERRAKQSRRYSDIGILFALLLW
jgi:hypothetical protein